VLLLTACGTSQTEGAAEKSPANTTEQVVIGISFDSLQIERWQKDRDYFIAQAEALGATCVFQDANGDAKKQNEQCDILLSQGIDVLVIVPKSATAAAQAVRKASAQNVPVLSYDRLILNSEPSVYISFDNERVGRMQAEYLTERVQGNYFLLGGSPDDNNAHLFRKGQMSVIQPLVDAGTITIIGDQWAEGWSPNKTRELTENMLVNAGTNVDAILASNDGTAGGAIQALRAQGLAGKVLVSGQDADLQGCKRILAGEQAMTVYKPIRQLAEKAAEVAVAMAKG
jgi:D-xylose transport system substrate-binding protein